MSTKKAKKSPAKKATKKAAKKAAAPMAPVGQFNWNELLTSDVKAAKTFYTKLLGWKTKSMDMGMDYTIFENEGKSAGGMMKAPMPGMPPQWLPYVTVKNIKNAVAKVTKLGGKIIVEPFPIPGTGMIAVALDPQGAAFGLHCS